MEWQLRNWLYFTWLSGDHICEQHVHNLDVDQLGAEGATRSAPSAWAAARSAPAPTTATSSTTSPIDYEYPNGVHVMSMCRQIDGCENNVSETVVGTKGTLDAAGGYRFDGGETSRGSAARRSTPTSRSTSTWSPASAPASRSTS